MADLAGASETASAEPLKYRAFLSYSHADSAAARRLHGRLEGFHIDKDLVGRTTAMGPIPKQLRPIFRDRHDFDAGGTLGEQTVAALDNSAALILLASPASARSRPVNEEVRLFQSRHPDRPLIPLILDGEPGHAERECFPPALGGSGDVLAADLRETGDGPRLALAKVVARLVGLAPDEVFRRAERDRRRRARFRHAIIGALAVLAVLASGSAVYAWHMLKTNEAFLDATLKCATDIVDTAVAQSKKYNVPRGATLAMLARAEQLFDDMGRLGRQTPELRYRKAQMLLQFAQNYSSLGDARKNLERAKEAHAVLAGLVQEHPGNTRYLEVLADSDIQLGHAFLDDDLLSDDALQSYQESLAFYENLCKSNPEIAKWQIGRVTALQWVAWWLSKKGQRTEALALYEQMLAIARSVAEAYPRDAGLHIKLSRVYFKAADMAGEMGLTELQLDAARKSVSVVRQLADSANTQTEWQVARAEASSLAGYSLMIYGQLREALEMLTESGLVYENLVKSDPSNVKWQEGFASARSGMGEVLFAQKDLTGSLAAHRDALAILGKAGLALDAETGRIGDVQAAQGAVADALQSYQTARNLLRRQAGAEPESAYSKMYLIQIDGKIGDLLVSQQRLPEALEIYLESVANAEELVSVEGSSGYVYHQLLAESHLALAGALEKLGQKSEAREHLIANRTILGSLVQRHPERSDWNRELARTEARIAAFDSTDTTGADR